MRHSNTFRLRIGFLVDSFAIGGSELNAIKLAEGLIRRSAQLTVFHFQQSGPLRERYEQLGVELLHVPLNGLLSRSAFNATVRIRSEAMTRGLQLLHTHCVYSNVVGAGVRRLSFRRLPLLASRRWTGYAARPGLHTLNAYAQSAADAVLVNSPNLQRVVTTESRFAHPVYIPNLLPAQNFGIVSPQVRRERRSALGLPPDGLIVGCVARLVAVKDHHTLLEAWRIVSGHVPSATLAIMGGGELRESLEAHAREIGIAESVRFTGEVKPEILPHSVLDVCALASLDEGFPNSLLEAMAQRVPVVSTNVGGISDLITSGQNGLLVQSGDAKALANGIVQLLTDKKTVARLVDNASVTATAHHEDVVLDSLLKLYRTIGLG